MSIDTENIWAKISRLELEVEQKDEHIKKLEERLECEWCMKLIADEAVHASCAIRHGEFVAQ